MAATDEELFSSGITTSSPLRTVYNMPIGHSSVPDQIQTTTDQTAINVRSLKVSLSENSRLERTDVSSTEFSTIGIHVVQVASPQIGINEATPLQVGGTQISITNNTTLTVVDAYGLKDTKTVTVYVGSTAPGSGGDPGFSDVAPQITDLPVPKKVYEQDPTNFSATAISPLGEQLTYTWNFGDGTDAAIGESVSHTFAASGQYNTTLTVTDDFGFQDTKTVTVYVGSTAPSDGGSVVSDTTVGDSTLPDGSSWNDIFGQFGSFDGSGFDNQNNWT